MNKQIDRRTWLKNTALLSGGVLLMPKVFSASRNTQTNRKSLSLTNRKLQAFKSPDIAAYETTPPVLKARLMYNENPFGPSEKAKKAIADSISDSYMYPFAEVDQLRDKIATYEKLTLDNIAVANGSSPFLMAASIVYGQGTIISSQASYEDLLGRAESYGSKVLRVPLTADFKYDLENIENKIDDNTSLVYICNPNNPTGTMLDPEKLKSFCRRVASRTMVYIDEAYIEIAPDPESKTLMGLIREGLNIVVSRTFSKLYGLAGIRAGYIVGQPETIKKLTAYTTDILEMSTPAVAAAVASYQDREFMDYAAGKIKESKEYLYSGLKKLGYSYIPSSTNFLIFPLKENSEKFAADMIHKGVGVRSWKINEKEWCRVSVGTIDQMKIFFDALQVLS